MSTKFFNNIDNTLYGKLKGISQTMQNFDRFLAVAGFFRSSGYFKLREEMENVNEIKILVGINIDDIFRKHNNLYEWIIKGDKAKEIYAKDFKQDILDAKYDPLVERGILQMFKDLKEGRLEMRIHKDRNLHAKFYLCLPNAHNENSDGWVIMGSSNISDSGLGITQAPRYELNVAMKDYDDVNFCYGEFVKLWSKAVPITIDDVEKYKKDTYLGHQPTPYEIYMKVLISVFGDEVEDNFTLELPEGVKDLKYQKDAVVQGYQMMMKHNGVFIADVVGLGKTIIATMIAKRYIEEKGNQTRILVVYPPSVEENWVNTFELFGIKKKKNARFISNGSLSHVMDEIEGFDMVIVDEAHGFRNDEPGKYEALQRICKSPCANTGTQDKKGKKVLLLSATPLNNSPEDLHNLLLLFQDDNACTIDGVPYLKTCFTEWEKRYKQIMKERDKRNVTSDIDKLYEEIRKAVIDKVTIRRTRNNILNSPDYKEDLKKQKITFPTVEEPQVQVYKMSPSTSELFYRTMHILSKDEEDKDDDDGDEDIIYMRLPQPQVLTYARFRAVEFLKPEFQAKYTPDIGRRLKGIYRVHMVKRLESSFYAFKKSLSTMLKATENMVKMFEQDKVLIIPKMKVNDKMMKGMELDEILEKAIEKGYVEDEILYSADSFLPEFRGMLEKDIATLKELIEDWKKVTEDPKFDTFRQGLEEGTYYKGNDSGKLVVFSESVDTLNYLEERLTKDMGKTDVLKVTAKDRRAKEKKIKENFDANFEKKKDKDKDEFNIILTSDVLAEGVNLHRSNVIINYDSPWNAIRLMQRIGRVNRIGSNVEKIYNYMFYPSQQGEKEIKLYKNALIKLQGFHTAFGEDAQIYSTEEIVKDFKLFNSNVKDSVDDKIMFQREARELFNTNRNLYDKIKKLPMKSRVLRESQKHSGQSIIFIQSNVKTEFYETTDNEINTIDFIQAAKTLKAKPEEKPVPFNEDSRHYEHVNKTIQEFGKSYDEQTDTLTVKNPSLDRTSQKAKNFIDAVIRELPIDSPLVERCRELVAFIENGKYNKFPKRVNAFTKSHNLASNTLSVQQNMDLIIKDFIIPFAEEYGGKVNQAQQEGKTKGDPQIIISETFI